MLLSAVSNGLQFSGISDFIHLQMVICNLLFFAVGWVASGSLVAWTAAAG